MSRTYRIELTDPALADIEDTLRYTLNTYGRKAAKEYDNLIRQALRDLGENPTRPGSKARPEIHPSIRSYHISLSTKRADSPVKSPRHLVLYFEVPKEGAIAISRILHDARDLSRHMPDEHRKAMALAKKEQGRTLTKDRGRSR